jgi:hypothetical protein
VAHHHRSTGYQNLLSGLTQERHHSGKVNPSTVANFGEYDEQERNNTNNLCMGDGNRRRQRRHH